jgi:hypothetical protein
MHTRAHRFIAARRPRESSVVASFALRATRRKPAIHRYFCGAANFRCVIVERRKLLSVVFSAMGARSLRANAGRGGYTQN